MLPFMLLIFIVVIILACSNVVVATASCSGNISAAELKVLESIYTATHGAYWNLTICGIPPYPDAVHGNPWVFPAALDSPCTDNWAGINCTVYSTGDDNVDDVVTEIPDCKVIALNLSYCNLTGYWPNDIANMSHLRLIDVRVNSLTGSFPSEIADLAQLKYLDASYNAFTSTIPDELGKLSWLEYLNLYTNDFTSTLPSSIGNLTQLQYLGLGDSYASGTIPECYLQLTNLFFLSISYTVITGVIPTNIHVLSKLEYFVIAENLITGTVPEINSMDTVLALVINTNVLSVLPVAFPPNLEIVIFYNNIFEGTLPESIYQSRLNELLIYGNHLTGSLPSTFGTATNLASMNVMKNRFTGCIPSTLGFLSNLVFSVFTTNYFSGPLPTNLGGLVSLEVLQISNTFITGSVPSEFGLVDNLFELYLTNGYLTGPIPSQIGQCGVLNTLELAENYLTGLLPSYAIRNITTLQSLNFTRNLLHGNTYSLFQTDSSSSSPTMSTLLNLVSIDLSFNSFTGTIPNAMFTLPMLQTVSLLMNCFEGTLSPHICDATSLEVLILDGLSSGEGCQIYIPSIFKPVIKGTFFNGYISGSIPSCIFQLRNLTALHLSGNGLTGTISDIPRYSSLVDVAISSNYLTGSIPMSIQRSGKFLQLALSNNRFSGTLSKNFSVNPSQSKLDLTVNRLSGPVPETFIDVTNIAILNGNSFGCNLVPKYDPSSSNYVCGSLALNVSMSVWVISWGVLVLALACAWAYFHVTRSQDPALRCTATAAASNQSILSCEENPMALSVDAQALFPAQRSLMPTKVPSKTLSAVESSGSISPSLASSDSSSSSFSSLIVEAASKTHLWWATQHLTKRSFATSMLLFILKAAAHVSCVLALFYLTFVLSAFVLMKVVGRSSISTHVYQYAYISTAAYMHGLAPTMVVVVSLLIGAFVITIFFFRVLSKLIQISDYFAAKTRMLVMNSERQMRHEHHPQDPPGGPDDMEGGGMEFGCIPMPSVDRSTREEQGKSIEMPPLSSSLSSLSNNKSLAANDGIDHQPVRPSETIYRNRSSIMNLFGADRSTDRSRKSSKHTIAAQLQSHWVSGYSTTSSSRWFVFLRELLLHLINAALTISLNAAYVALLLSGRLSPQALSFIQILLGVSKVAWKALLVPYLIAQMLYNINRSDQIFHQVFIDVFNFIASPVIATLLTDSSCFLNVFQAKSPVTTEYTVNANFYEVCLNIVNNTAGNSSGVSTSCHSVFAPTSVTESVLSPWVYSYQCSSSIFVNYVPVLFYTFTFSGVVVPLVQFILMFARDDTIQYFMKESYRHAILTNRIYWPSFVSLDEDSVSSSELSDSARARATTTSSNASGASTTPTASVTLLFNVGTLISTIILHFSVLMTFGMVSPVLGLCISVSLIILASQWRLVIGRYLTTCPLPQPILFKRIEEATSGICSGIFGCLRILVVMVSIFWGVICFDFVADVYGIKIGIVVTVIILLLIPLPFVMVFYFPKWFLLSRFTLTSDWNFSTPTNWSNVGLLAPGVQSHSQSQTQSQQSTDNNEANCNISTDVTSVSASGSNADMCQSDANLSSGRVVAADPFGGIDPSAYLRDSFFLPRWTDDF